MFEFQQFRCIFAPTLTKLRYMCKTLLVLFFSILTSVSFSQVAEQQLETKEKSVPEIQKEPSVSEATPSLEEQGFKPVVLNGKIIYRKEVNGFIIEFIPEAE